MRNFWRNQKIRIFVRIMQRLLLPSSQTSQMGLTHDKIEQKETEKVMVVRQDVKKGHFAVFAVLKCHEKPERFVVELRHLRNPVFLNLLERAEEEYGFQHGGALTVPCSPEDYTV